MKRPVVLLMLVCLALASPAGAFHDPPIPQLYRTDFTGSRAVSIQFNVDAPAHTSVEIETTYDASESFGLGMWLMDSAGNPAGIFGFFGTGGGTEVHLQSAPSGVVVDQHDAGSAGGAGIALEITALDPGTYTLVALASSDDDTSIGDAVLYGDEHVTYLQASESDNVIMKHERDFDGLVNAEASGAGTVKARAILQGAVEHAFTDRVFGWFAAQFTDPATVMGYDASDGAHDGATDYLLSGGPAGDYKFRVDASVGGPTFLSSLWLFAGSTPVFTAD